MNEFEARMNALRLKFKAERVEIQKAGNRQIGHLCTSIDHVKFPEVVELIKEEIRRVKAAMRSSIDWNLLCYRQQLDLIQDEYKLHLRTYPSRTVIKRSIYAASRAQA